MDTAGWRWWLASVEAHTAAAVALPLYAYARFVRPLGPGLWPTVRFAAGWVALAVALVSPLHRAADRSSFFLHVIQNMLLQMVAPPLMLLGVPETAWQALAQHPRAFRVLRVLLHPLPAAAAYNGVLVVWHWPVPGSGGVRLACGVMTDLARRFPGVELLQDLLPPVTGLFFWASVLVNPPLSPAPAAGRFAALVASMVVNWLVSFPIALSDTPMYGVYAATRPPFGLGPLGDQKLGAGVMWEHANMTYVAAVLAILRRSLPFTGTPRTRPASGTPEAPALPPAVRSPKT